MKIQQPPPFFYLQPLAFFFLQTITNHRSQKTIFLWKDKSQITENNFSMEDKSQITEEEEERHTMAGSAAATSAAMAGADERGRLEARWAQVLGSASGMDVGRHAPAVAVVGRCAVAERGCWVLAGVGGGSRIEREEAVGKEEGREARLEGGREGGIGCGL